MNNSDLFIQVKLTNAYAEGVHPTLLKIRKKTVKPSRLSNSTRIHQVSIRNLGG